MELNPSRKYVPPKALIITILPIAQAFSLNSTTCTRIHIEASKKVTYIGIKLALVNAYHVVVFPLVAQLGQLRHGHRILLKPINEKESLCVPTGERRTDHSS